jgi:group I intron endonuclease
MAESGIYEIVNLVNGKRYVGSAANLEQRWREHRSALRRGDHANIHLRRAWNKHGETKFVFRAIERCSVVELIGREQVHIDVRAEYNICPTAGSTLGRPHSDETRLKIGARKAGLKMGPRSDQHRASLSKSNAGKTRVRRSM